MEQPSSDLAFEEEMKAAWGEVQAFMKKLSTGEADQQDNPQYGLAEKCFQYYLTHPESSTGEKALMNAFVMWSNLPSADRVDEAIKQVDPDSSQWEIVLHGMQSAYARSGRDMNTLLEKWLILEKRLTHPHSLAGLHMKLGDHFFHKKEAEKAKPYFEKVVAAQINPFHTDRAAGMLREMRELAEQHNAPDFTCESLSGEEICLSNLRGKVVLLDFWSSDCGPCIPEIAHLKKIFEQHSRDDLIIVGISNDGRLENLEAAIDKHGIEWPQVWQPMRITDKVPELGQLFKLYNVYGIPSTYLIDRNGVIANKRLRGRALEKAVEEIVLTKI